MIRAALLGAVLVHPVVFLVAFLKGMVSGANPSFGGGYRMPDVFGWDGGFVSMQELLFVYLITMGLAPLIVSAAGASLGAGALLLVRMRVPSRANSLVAWGTVGAIFGALGGTTAAIVVMNAAHDEWTGASRAAVVGAVIGSLFWGMGSWLPRTLGGGLGAAVGAWCAAPGDVHFGSEWVGFVCGLLTAVLVGTVVGELCRVSSANQVNPDFSKGIP